MTDSFTAKVTKQRSFKSHDRFVKISFEGGFQILYLYSASSDKSAKSEILIGR